MQPEDYILTKDLTISIILPIYNGGVYLESSIKSVLNQSLKNFEFLIIDDCSTDGSWEYLMTIDDPRIKIYRNEVNKGLFYNLNYLIKKSSGDLLKLWAQDDIMYPQCLEKFVSFFKMHSNIGFCYSGRDIINEYGIVFKNNTIDNTPEIISSDLHARIAFFTGSIAGNIANVCINRSALDKVGLFNGNMKISADFDMWVRLAREFDTGFINRRLIQLRDHPGQLSRNEAYYIYHVREDILVYRNLLGYVGNETRRKGRLLLRKHKLVFYYTLMIKSMLKGKWGNTFQFYKELRSIDNFSLLTLSFLRAKLLKYF